MFVDFLIFVVVAKSYKYRNQSTDTIPILDGNPEKEKTHYDNGDNTAF